MKIQYATTAVFILILIEVKCKENINDEQQKNKRTDNAKRRFSEDLDDTEWHISHLKDPDFIERDECEEEHLDASIKKYKSALSNDGALVTFVSSDPIINNRTHSKLNMCPKGNVTIQKFEIDDLKSKDSNYENLKLNVTEEQHNETNTATTVNAKANVKPGEKSKNATGTINRRTSDYLFSSVEYYDEVVDFDASACPDAVDVIVLEIDQLRSYDVECEMILEWQSLD